MTLGHDDPDISVHIVHTLIAQLEYCNRAFAALLLGTTPLDALTDASISALSVRGPRWDHGARVRKKEGPGWALVIGKGKEQRSQPG
jgi:hypothetical protein